MQHVKVYLEFNDLFDKEVRYVLALLKSACQLTVAYVNEPNETNVHIGIGKENLLVIDDRFYQDIHQGIYGHQHYFIDKPLLCVGDTPDYISSVFYLINAVQEYDLKDRDALGRFSYQASIQKRFDIVRQNLVQTYLNQIAKTLCPSFIPSVEKSSVFISHDIDEVYGSWTQDLAFSIRKMHFLDMGKILASFFIQKSSWFNFDQIMKMKSEHDFKSLFLFIVQKGKSKEGLKNADYLIDSPQIRRAIAEIKSNGFELGLHKSVSDSDFKEELKLLKEPVICNRHHYLRFHWPDLLTQMEASGLLVDTSLGYAEEYGFRNNFALPFVPFSVKERRVSTFVEVPLHIMDRTFYAYRKDPVSSVSKNVIQFFEENKYNAIISLLWHNNFYTSVKFDGYLNELKKILSYLHEEKIKGITAKEIANQFLNDEKSN
jgi:hypothetical protein